MKRFFPLLAVFVFVSCASNSTRKEFKEKETGEYTIRCENCPEAQWAKGARKFCSEMPELVGEKNLPLVDASDPEHPKSVPFPVRTYRCPGKILRH